VIDLYKARIDELERVLRNILPHVHTGRELAQFSANERQDTPISDALESARSTLNKRNWNLDETSKDKK
jgi:hypothetical protein